MNLTPLETLLGGGFLATISAILASAATHYLVAKGKVAVPDCEAGMKRMENEMDNKVDGQTFQLMHKHLCDDLSAAREGISELQRGHEELKEDVVERLARIEALVNGKR